MILSRPANPYPDEIFGKDNWIEDVLVDLKRCLLSDEIPNKPPDCEFCGYAFARAEQEHARAN